jgi:hypothetical protein
MKQPSFDNPELIASFSFCGATHRITIFYEDRGTFDFWHACYRGANGSIVARLSAESRERLLQRIVVFMEAAPDQCWESLLQLQYATESG